MDVRKAVLACIRNAYTSKKGYIVASGCSLPTETPFGNIHAMMDTVREVGYPINEEKINYLI
jgi:Uroporphyrinogen-III decarboxylase